MRMNTYSGLVTSIKHFCENLRTSLFYVQSDLALLFAPFCSLSSLKRIQSRTVCVQSDQEWHLE